METICGSFGLTRIAGAGWACGFPRTAGERRMAGVRYESYRTTSRQLVIEPRGGRSFPGRPGGWERRLRRFIICSGRGRRAAVQPLWGAVWSHPRPVYCVTTEKPSTECLSWLKNLSCSEV